MVAFNNKTQDSEDLFSMDSEVVNFTRGLAELKSIRAGIDSGEVDKADAIRGSKLFYDTVQSITLGSDETLTLVDESDTVTYPYYESLMSTLDSKVVSTLAVAGKEYGYLENWAWQDDKTVSEYVNDNCEQLAKRYAECFPKFEAKRQKQIARDAHSNNEALRLKTGGDYDHETAPNKYANVREKAIQRVGNALKYPSVPHQSQYGFKSLGVIRFVRELLYQTAGMDAYEQVIYDHMLHYTDECGYVSIGHGQIAKERFVGETKIKKTIKRFIESGLIELVYAGNGLSGKTSRYRLTLSCSAGMDSEEFLAKRWFVLTGKTDMDNRWDRQVEIQNAK